MNIDKEILLSFMVWLAENEPDCLYKYQNDEDGGREAFEELLTRYIDIHYK